MSRWILPSTSTPTRSIFAGRKLTVDVATVVTDISVAAVVATVVTDISVAAVVADATLLLLLLSYHWAKYVAVKQLSVFSVEVCWCYIIDICCCCCCCWTATQSCCC